MLWFNVKNYKMLVLFGWHFNTSYVVVQRVDKLYGMWYLYYFNTSYVVVQR